MIVALAPFADIPCDRTGGTVYRAHPLETRLPTKCASCVKSAQACTYTPEYPKSNSDKAGVVLNFAKLPEFNRTLKANPLPIPSGKICNHNQLFAYHWRNPDPSRNNIHYANVDDLEIRITWARAALLLGGYSSECDNKGVEYFTYEKLPKFTSTPFDLSDLHDEGDRWVAKAAKVDLPSVSNGKHKAGRAASKSAMSPIYSEDGFEDGFEEGELIDESQDESKGESQDDSDEWIGSKAGLGVEVGQKMQGNGRLSGKRPGVMTLSGRSKRQQRQQESTSAGRPSQQTSTLAPASLPTPPALNPNHNTFSVPNQQATTSQPPVTATQAPLPETTTSLQQQIDIVSLTPAWMAVMAESVRSTTPDSAQQNRILGSLYGAWGSFVAKHGSGV